MALMINNRGTEYEGEKRVWDCLKAYLPDDIVVYNNLEVNGREFDFCVISKEIGILIIEVKGWNLPQIERVENADTIYLLGQNEPVGSPKKQANVYRYNLLNMIKDTYNISPLVISMVCYPFLSEKDYLKKRLDIVSEKKFTIFQEDLVSSISLGSKINAAYNSMKTIPHTYLDKALVWSIRSLFEPLGLYKDDNKEMSQDTKSIPYSVLQVFKSELDEALLEKLYELYFYGSKIYLFVSVKSELLKVRRQLNKKLAEKMLSPQKGNIIANVNKICTNFENDNIVSYRCFNFEVYLIENLSEEIQDLTIYEGEYNDSEKDLIDILSVYTSFNNNQFYIEHADSEKNTLVKAGAGTGKTYSMVSRIAYLCNNKNKPVISLADSIAMVTFTNEAANNMKRRLKQLFINYFNLTKNPKYIKFIEEVEQMQVSTIHKFAKKIIQTAGFELGLGKSFSVTSSDFSREKIYEKYLDAYVKRKKDETPDFINSLSIPIYVLKKLLVRFSKQLYNKSIDIKSIPTSALGGSIEVMPFLNEMISEVVIAAENEYSQELKEHNIINLSEYMILLNNVINENYKTLDDFKYKYLFVDEFQDTDDVQISSFLGLQDIVGFKLFVVGDLKQSIYRFRGATIGAFDKLNYSYDTWEEYSLNTNYRTDRRLLEKYDDIFAQIGRQGYLPFVSKTDNSKNNDSLNSDLEFDFSESELIRVIDCDEDTVDLYNKLFDEIEHQRDLMEKLGREKKLNREEATVAILVRENWQIESIIKEAKKRGVRVETQVGGDLFQLSPAIDFYKLVLALNNPLEPIYLFNLICSNNIGITVDIQGLYKKTKEQQIIYLIDILDQYYLATLQMSWRDIILSLQNNPVLMVLKRIFDKCKPWLNYSDNVDEQRFYKVNYELVLEKIIKSHSVDYLTLNYICNSLKINITTEQEEMAREIIDSRDEVKCTVLCTTIHKSKGLEYGCVMLPYTYHRIDDYKKADLDVIYYEGKLGYSVKINKKKYNNNNYNRNFEISQRIQEEARVLYVALTRAIHNFVWFRNVSEEAGLNWSKLLEGKT
ncbi:UvrD/REP helicase [Ruminiclostridium papyrosolvens DSM 2782]|uniref:DNA 3'-5' helicase n=1 Tax=Ruminiclostridium papyrosolvens DSM 2782 TaxID=588581 RepID=F1TIK7_9FIRM|nr:UvrD-helicase domain-containing protein [Ruminiclostridium papyrosolvens]EGD45824.1 UvrD/REP helicase [Ruminiclostridium papyrosolvens DSM 2782]WES33856.1 UvrD-helicase domain-containing protein [Ruminiclostridium papyrosolvens DSM 2782]